MAQVHTLPDALIVIALAALLGAYLYFKHRERQQRMEIIHQERLAAMDKGIPLPELPIDPPRSATARNPREALLHGIAWMALGSGGVVAMMMIPTFHLVWPAALPLLFLGVGLILYYVLGPRRSQ
jgi:hypothetical protein